MCEARQLRCAAAYSVNMSMLLLSGKVDMAGPRIDVIPAWAVMLMARTLATGMHAKVMEVTEEDRVCARQFECSWRVLPKGLQAATKAAVLSADAPRLLVSVL